MRVACIGNMNHMLFTLTRYLRKEGYDAHLFLHNDEAEHFMPEADAYTQDYRRYTHQLTWGSGNSFAAVTSGDVCSDIGGFDAYIASNTSPAFLHKAGITTDIFVPHGSDIYGLPAWGQEIWHQFAMWKLSITPKSDEVNRKLNQYRLSKAQRQAIRRAGRVLINETNIEFEQLLDKAISQDQRIKDPCPFVFTDQYGPDVIANYYASSSHYKRFKQVRDANDIVIFHHSRHEWCDPPNTWTQKGNDILFKGFAQVAKERSDVRMCLIVFEYGSDVNESKKLFADLGIEERVVWMPKMHRKDVMIGLSLADMGTGEFSRSWLSYGTVQEVLALGKPIMHYRDDSLYADVYPDLYPMASAHTVQEVVHTLRDLIQRPGHYGSMGKEGYQWYVRYMVERPVQQVCDYLSAIRAKRVSM